jgi:hypothetical protein
MRSEFGDLTKPAWNRLQRDLCEFWRSICGDTKTQAGAKPYHLAPFFVRYFIASFDLAIRTHESSSLPEYVWDQRFGEWEVDALLPPTVVSADSPNAFIGYGESLEDYETRTRETPVMVATFPADGVWERAVERSWKDASVSERCRNQWPEHPFQLCFRTQTIAETSLFKILLSEEIPRLLFGGDPSNDSPRPNYILDLLKESSFIRGPQRRAALSPILSEKGMTPSRWAARTGVDPSVVYDYLKGVSSPRPNNRKDLAAALGLDEAKLPE